MSLSPDVHLCKLIYLTLYRSQSQHTSTGSACLFIIRRRVLFVDKRNVLCHFYRLNFRHFDATTIITPTECYNRFSHAPRARSIDLSGGWMDVVLLNDMLAPHEQHRFAHEITTLHNLFQLVSSTMSFN